MRRLSSVVAVAIWLAAVSAASASPRCAGRPDLVGPCFPLRGRAALYNGTPSVRIWRVGTNRLLGVSARGCGEPGCEWETIPESLRGGLDWDHPVFADLVVCPLTHERPGTMQFVCVESATRIRRE